MDTKNIKYCSSLSKLNVHYAKYRKEILNIELGVGVYIRDGSRFSNIRIFYLIIEYRLGCAIIF